MTRRSADNKERNRKGGREGGKKERKRGKGGRNEQKKRELQGITGQQELDISNYKIYEDSEIQTHTHVHTHFNIQCLSFIQSSLFVLLVKKPIHCWMDKPKFVLFGTTEERPNLGFSSQLPY